MAIAQAHTASVFNRPGFDIIGEPQKGSGFNVLDNYTFCYFGDGCAQEGVACEAASLAGHLQLGNLICVYDDNHISIDGDTACSPHPNTRHGRCLTIGAFTEDVLKRFEAYGY